jgi:hypothetical protein
LNTIASLACIPVKIASQTALELGIVLLVEVLLITVSGVKTLFAPSKYKVVPPITIVGPLILSTVNVLVDGLYLKLSLTTGVPSEEDANQIFLAALEVVSEPIPA